MGLAELRAEIDNVDHELVSAIMKRSSLIRQISQYKKDNQLPLFAPERESEILSNMSKQVPYDSLAGLQLLYGVLFDIIRFNEYQAFPQEITARRDWAEPLCVQFCQTVPVHYAGTCPLWRLPKFLFPISAHNLCPVESFW
jgi:hypothetical protein